MVISLLFTECLRRRTLSALTSSAANVRAMTYMMDMPLPVRIMGAYVDSFNAVVWK